MGNAVGVLSPTSTSIRNKIDDSTSRRHVKVENIIVTSTDEIPKINHQESNSVRVRNNENSKPLIHSDSEPIKYNGLNGSQHSIRSNNKSSLNATPKSNNNSTSIGGIAGVTGVPPMEPVRDLVTIRSLRQMAVRHHSRQENIYIPNEVVISSAFAVKRMAHALASHAHDHHAAIHNDPTQNQIPSLNTSNHSSNSITSTTTNNNSNTHDNANYRKHNKNLTPLTLNSNSSDDPFASSTILTGIAEQNESMDMFSPTNDTTNLPKSANKPNLKINIHDDNEDEIDWIPVVEDDNSDDDTARDRDYHANAAG